MKRGLRHIITMSVLLLGILGRGSVYAQIDADQTRALGMELMATEDYLLAIQYFNKTIKAKPYLCEPYYLRGSAKMMLGDYSGAVTDCSQAIELNNYKQDPYRIRGLSYLYLDEDSLALKDFESGLRQAPSDRRLLLYKGISESRLGRRHEADRTFETLRRLYPAFIQAYTAQAHSALRMRDTASAVSCLEQALAHDRYNPAACEMLSEIALDRHQWQYAESLLNRALQLNPHNDALYVNRGVARYAMGQTAESMADMASALEINPYNTVAAANIELMHNPATSSDKFPSTIRIQITDIPAVPGRHLSHPAHENIQGIKPIGMFALTFTHPYNNNQPATYPYPELRNFNTKHKFPSGLYISPTADATPDAEQAVALFAYAENMNPATMTAEQYLGRAVAHTMLKNYDAALSDLDRVITDAPSLVTPLIERAFARIAQAQARVLTHRMFEDGSATENGVLLRQAYMRAAEDLQMALSKDPQMAYGWYNLGVLYQETGQYHEAIEAYTKAVVLDEMFAEAYFNRGLIYLSRHNRSAAASDLSRAGELGISAAYRALRANMQ